MDSVYTLNNGAKGIEENRLDAQHYRLFTPLTGGLLPAHIRSHLESIEDSPAVADIATGTGVWLRELAAELPASARLDGFDFDISKFGQNCPPNVKLAYANMLEPFSADLHGQYDLVHLRLVKFGVKADELQFLATNLMTLLKPGGWLLWDELSYSSWTCMPMTKNFFEWMSLEVKYATMVGRDPNIGVTLCRRIKKAGFVNCSLQSFSSFGVEDETIRTMSNMASIAAARQSLHGMVSKGGFEHIKTHDDATRLIDALTTEVELGATQHGFETYWTTGQKPLPRNT